ncbi:MAG: N-acetyl-gamma-glutamyl-phosphate reductase [Deltaproteobacteria bacterium]|nr:N-acetyl-gamma-glutamyl-phosphate reductase [Deltaproteobacteria bacterium]
MTKRFKAAIIGGSGYGGAELIRRLIIHPEVELARVASVDYVGESLGAAHPNLEGITEHRFQDVPPAEAVRGCDVALLALPHKVTAAKVPELVATGVKIVDMSGDFRLRDAGLYERYYGARHPHPELLGTFAYGLPEIFRETIHKSKYVASPGCFATSMELALYPLAKAGLLRGAVHVTGLTGSSGSGISPTATTHHPSRAGNLRTYKPLEHQHVPEVTQVLGDAGAKDWELRFVPVSAPLVRGIFTTAYVEVPADVDDKRVAALFDACYAGEPFVRRPKKRLPEVVAVAGSNHAEVGFVVSPPRGESRTVACFAAIDNLIKGGAGQAIQNMNLVLGLDEKLSLEDPGSWP